MQWNPSGMGRFWPRVMPALMLNCSVYSMGSLPSVMPPVIHMVPSGRVREAAPYLEHDARLRFQAKLMGICVTTLSHIMVGVFWRSTLILQVIYEFSINDLQ